MTLFPKILGGYSGTLVEILGYEYFLILFTGFARTVDHLSCTKADIN